MDATGIPGVVQQWRKGKVCGNGLELYPWLGEALSFGVG